MSHIFVSYSQKKDTQIANKIVTALAEQNIETWIDWKKIPPGEELTYYIERGIETADAFLFLVSPDSVKSKWCNKEFTHAKEHKKKTIAVLIRDTEQEEMPEALSDILRVNCRNELDDFRVAIEEIQSAIHRDNKWLDFHNKLQNKALEWERNKKDSSRLLRGKELLESKEIIKSGNQKDSSLTNLQNEFIAQSEKDAENKKHRDRTILIISFFVLISLCCYALYQTNIAIGQSVKANEAEAKQIEAETKQAEQITIAQAANAQAVIAQLTSEAEKTRADIEAVDALVNKLSVQSQFLSSDTGPVMIKKSLLAIEGIRLKPKPEIIQTVHTALGLLPSLVYSKNMDYAYAFPTSISADGKYIAFWDFNNKTLYIQETKTGKEIIHIKNVRDWGSIAFGPGEELIAYGDGKGKLHVFSMKSGEEKTVVDLVPYRIRSLTFNPKGDKILSSLYEKNSVIVTDVNSANNIALKSHNGDVMSIDFNNSGNLAISCGMDKAIRVSDVITGKVVLEKQSTEYVRSCKFSPDGKLIAAIDARGSIKVWSITGGDEITHLDNDFIHSFTFSNDSQGLALGLSNGKIQLWKVLTNEATSLEGHSASVSYVRFSHDDGRIFSAGDDSMMRVWNIETGKVISQIPFAYDSLIANVIINSEDNLAVVYNSDNDKADINVWNVTPDPEIPFIHIQGWIFDINLNKNVVAVSGGKENTFDILDLITGNKIANIAQSNKIDVAKFSPDGALVAIGNEDGTIQMFDTVNGEKVSDILSTSSIYAIAFSSNNQFIVSGNAEDLVQVWDIDSGKEVFRRAQDGMDVISCVSFSPDNKFVMSHDSWLATTQVWSLLTGKEVFSIDNGGSLQCSSFNPNGNLVVTSDDNDFYSVGVWDFVTQQKVLKLKHDYHVTVATVSPDGRWIATGSADGISKLWAADTGKEIFVTIHEKPVSIISFSLDSKLVAFADEANTIRVFETNSGLEVSRIKSDSLINYLAISPQNDWLISSHRDGNIRKWLLSNHSLITELCGRLPRNLTQLEWQQYFNDAPYRTTCPNLPIPTEEN